MDRKSADGRLPLGSRQRFHGIITKDLLRFNPDEKWNRLPDIQAILWQTYHSFLGDLNPEFDTRVTLNPGAAPDMGAYARILEPRREDPDGLGMALQYKYVPLLSRARMIQQAWLTLLNQEKKQRMASQNLSDVLALRQPTYYVRCHNDD